MSLTKNQKIKVAGIIISSLFSLFSIFALIVSIYSLIISIGVSKDYRKVEGLDIEPEIRFIVSLVDPPSFSISNVGRTEAIRVVVHFVFHRYNPESKEIIVSSCGNKQQIFIIEQLSSMETKTFDFSEQMLSVNKGLIKPEGKDVVEAIITYMRNPDRKVFIRRTIYFVDSEGKWWNERYSHVISEEYKKIKDNVLNKPLLSCSDYDILNEVNMDNSY